MCGVYLCGVYLSGVYSTCVECFRAAATFWQHPKPKPIFLTDKSCCLIHFLKIIRQFEVWSFVHLTNLFLVAFLLQLLRLSTQMLNKNKINFNRYLTAEADCGYRNSKKVRHRNTMWKLLSIHPLMRLTATVMLWGGSPYPICGTVRVPGIIQPMPRLLLTSSTSSSASDLHIRCIK